MKENDKKSHLSFYFFLIFILVGGIYFTQKKVVDNGNAVIFPEGDTSGKEAIDVEIVSEEKSLMNDNEEKAVEKVIEDDVEELSVNEEPEETIIKKTDKKKTEPLVFPAPLKRKNDPGTLRIGFMTDLHVQSIGGLGKSLDDFYVEKMNYFAEKMNNIFSPNFILLNGDIIEGTRTNSEIGNKELSLVKNIFDRTMIKKYWVAGNHDLRSVDKKQWMSALDIDYMSKSFDVGGYKIIILDGNFTKEDLDVGPGINYTRGKVSQKQVEWLRKELEKTSKKTIVFMHYPPLRDIDAKINLGLLYNTRELQDIFSHYGVLAVFSGHIEDVYYQEIGGVNYFVSPGMVKYPKYTGAFSEITIQGKKISITLNYLLDGGKYRSVKIEKE